MARSALDINYGPSDNRREAFRAFVTDINVRIEGKSEVYPVRDISSAGLGIASVVGLEVGEPVLISLFQRGTIIAIDLITRVARVEDDAIGLYFDNLERRQLDAVHAIVLHIQKEQLEEQKFHPSFIH
jgi:hypothetical protein